jgi:hypothetical protein
MNTLYNAASPDPDSHPVSESFKYEDLLAQCIHFDDAERLHRTVTKGIPSTSVYELKHRIVRHAAFLAGARCISPPCAQIRTTR